MTKWVYGFGGGDNDGRAEMKNLLGGKGANLAEMASIGLPVPPGFTITTEVCTAYYDNKERYPDDLAAQVDAALAKVEAVVGQKFGDPANPLLVSVRSGARVSMPGMMDTVLNLGLNDETVIGLAKAANDGLPSAAAIAKRLRERPVGVVLAEICRELGISNSDPLWNQAFLPILAHGGRPPFPSQQDDERRWAAYPVLWADPDVREALECQAAAYLPPSGAGPPWLDY